jgi:hypothetical protein
LKLLENFIFYLLFFSRLYAQPGSRHCPVLLTIRYFEFLSGHVGSVIPQCSPGNPNTPHPSRVLSYTNATEDLHYMLRYVGVEPRGFTEHSMKRGGATEAARYNNINDIFSFSFLCDILRYP